MSYISTFGYWRETEVAVEPFVITSDTKKADGSNGDWRGFDGAEVLDDGEIIVEDYIAAFRDDRDFALLLAKHMKSGIIRLEFTGEDGDVWGYVVAPNAVVELQKDLPIASYIEGDKELFKREIDRAIEKLERDIEFLKKKKEGLR